MQRKVFDIIKKKIDIRPCRIVCWECIAGADGKSASSAKFAKGGILMIIIR